MARDIASELEALLAPLAADHALELVAVEVAGSGGRPVVRVLLDQEGGIGIDAIAAANTWIGTAIDEYDGLTGAFVLEVSSPGIERPLRKPADFARFSGSTVEVKTTAPQDGRKTFVGTILRADDEAIVLDAGGDEVRIGYADIRKARLKVDLDFG